MFIIFGTRGVPYTKAEGEFSCPECRSQQPYRHKRVRRFFTLFFIPIIPLDLLGEYIECAQCHSKYKLEVLNGYTRAPAQPQAPQAADFTQIMLRTITQLMLEKRALDEESLQDICRLYLQATDEGVSHNRVNELAGQIQSDRKALPDYLMSIKTHLTGKEAEGLITAACQAIRIEDPAAKRTKLQAIATAIEMTPTHFDGLAASLSLEG